MRILILGGDGMLGHQLLKSWRETHEVRVTLRGEQPGYRQYDLFDQANSFFGVDVREFGSVESVVQKFGPHAVVNAVGIVKQRPEARDAIPSIEVNSLLPHRLSVVCGRASARLVHLSTDCVFSGSRGLYSENDLEDARDLYGRSKLLGEVKDAHAVTLRTSIIGVEIARKTGLVEWFLGASGCLKGFRKAFFSGFTTQEMARIIENLLINHPTLDGLWHVASERIDKYTLLEMFRERLGDSGKVLVPDDSFICDRSLNGERFKEVVDYQPPTWGSMLDELVAQVRERSN